MENSGSSAILKYELHNFNLLLATVSTAQTWLVSEDLWSWYSLFLGSSFRHRFPTFKPPGESGRASVSAFTMIVTWHVGVLLLFTGRKKKRNTENKWKQMRKTVSWTGHARKKAVQTFATVAATAESCSRSNMPIVRGILPFFWATAWLSADDGQVLLEHHGVENSQGLYQLNYWQQFYGGVDLGDYSIFPQFHDSYLHIVTSFNGSNPVCLTTVVKSMHFKQAVLWWNHLETSNTPRWILNYMCTNRCLYVTYLVSLYWF